MDERENKRQAEEKRLQQVEQFKQQQSPYTSTGVKRVAKNDPNNGKNVIEEIEWDDNTNRHTGNFNFNASKGEDDKNKDMNNNSLAEPMDPYFEQDISTLGEDIPFNWRSPKSWAAWIGSELFVVSLLAFYIAKGWGFGEDCGSDASDSWASNSDGTDCDTNFDVTKFVLFVAVTSIMGLIPQSFVEGTLLRQLIFSPEKRENKIRELLQNAGLKKTDTDPLAGKEISCEESCGITIDDISSVVFALPYWIFIKLPKAIRTCSIDELSFSDNEELIFWNLKLPLLVTTLNALVNITLTYDAVKTSMGVLLEEEAETYNMPPALLLAISLAAMKGLTEVALGSVAVTTFAHKMRKFITGTLTKGDFSEKDDEFNAPATRIYAIKFIVNQGLPGLIGRLITAVGVGGFPVHGYHSIMRLLPEDMNSELAITLAAIPTFCMVMAGQGLVGGAMADFCHDPKMFWYEMRLRASKDPVKFTVALISSLWWAAFVGFGNGTGLDRLMKNAFGISNDAKDMAVWTDLSILGFVGFFTGATVNFALAGSAAIRGMTSKATRNDISMSYGYMGVKRLMISSSLRQGGAEAGLITNNTNNSNNVEDGFKEKPKFKLSLSCAPCCGDNV